MEQIAGSLVVFFLVTSGGPDFVDSKKTKKVLAFYYEIHDSWLYLCIYICRYVYRRMENGTKCEWLKISSGVLATTKCQIGKIHRKTYRRVAVKTPQEKEDFDRSYALWVAKSSRI